MADEFNPFENQNEQSQPFGQPEQPQQAFGQAQQTYNQTQQQFGQGQQPFNQGQPQPFNQPQYGQQYAQQPYYGQQPVKSGKSTAALVLGIIALIGGFLIPFVGLICGIIGIVMAGKARREGDTSGAVKAGRILSIIGLVLSLIVIVIGVVMGVALVNSPEFMQQVEQIMNQQ
ncbi:MAG: hypothetical protein IKE31_08270 [Eubacterium sp.]|nr:hypothetical protein [Eubacterium sp.]